MKAIRAALLSVVFCTVVSASSKEETRTAFFGEDVHIEISSWNNPEVVFRSKTNSSSEVLLLQGDRVMNQNKTELNHSGHSVSKDVQEEDEGSYIIRDGGNSSIAKYLSLIVRDCALEQVVKYGDSYTIHSTHIEAPITSEFRPSSVRINETVVPHISEPPPVVLYNKTTVSGEEFVGRLSVSDREVISHSVRMMDEGSFTVSDRNGHTKMRSCSNVRDHQRFSHLPYGENSKMKSFQHYSNLNVVYRSKTDNQDSVIVNKGVSVSPSDPQSEGRLIVDGSELIMKKIHTRDTGVFKVTDSDGFRVAHVYIDVEAYKLPPSAVAISSMVGSIAFMVLLCSSSCLYKIHKRNEKNKKSMLIAQQAGKGDGEAFRQVVQEAYSRFTEESSTQSVCDKPTETTEVTIKGLEVSKPGRYHTLPSDNFLEMSDSGVEFTLSGNPSDSDTEAVMTYASHKPLSNAASPPAIMEGAPPDSSEATVASDGDLSAIRTPDSIMSASPASNPRSVSAATPDGSSQGAASPATASRGTAESGSAKTEGGEEDGQK